MPVIVLWEWQFSATPGGGEKVWNPSDRDQWVVKKNWSRVSKNFFQPCGRCRAWVLGSRSNVVHVPDDLKIVAKLGRRGSATRSTDEEQRS